MSRREVFVIVVIANGLSIGDNIVESNMIAATLLCKNCKIKFQLIGISAYPKYCPYCGKESVETDNLIFG
jgi:Zn finger protein HypA/HybF involved in hydrogenase expression